MACRRKTARLQVDTKRYIPLQARGSRVTWRVQAWLRRNQRDVDAESVNTMKTRFLVLLFNALLVSPAVYAQVAAEVVPDRPPLDLSLPRDFVAETWQSPQSENAVTLPEMGGVRGVSRRNGLPNDLPYGAGYEARQRGAQGSGQMAGQGRAGRRKR